MRRLSRAVALGAATLALPLGSTACGNEKDRTAAAPAATPGQRAPAATRPPAPTPGGPHAQQGKPDSVQDKHVAAAESIVARATSLGDALQAARGDCEAAASALESGAPELQQVMADSQQLQMDLGNDYRAMKWFQKTYGQKMMVSLQRVGALLQQCSKDKKFMATFERLGLHGRLGRPLPPPAGGTEKQAEPSN